MTEGLAYILQSPGILAMVLFVAVVAVARVWRLFRPQADYGIGTEGLPPTENAASEPARGQGESGMDVIEALNGLSRQHAYTHDRPKAASRSSDRRRRTRDLSRHH